MTSTPALAPPSRSTSFTTIALTVLIVLLGAVPLLLAAAVLVPALAPSLGVPSPAMAWVLGAVVAVGVLLTRTLTTMGRVGVIMLAVGAAGLAIGRSLSTQPGGGPAFDNGMIDATLMFLIPSGYFLLLFGALRAAHWARIGTRVIAIVATALAVVPFIVPTDPLADIDTAERLVTHGLLIAGAIVAVIAVVIEFARSKPVQSPQGPEE